MTQEFINSETGKSFTISLKGKMVVTKTGNRTNEKPYASKDKAEMEFQKMKWEKLKKGFVFCTDQSKKGEARFHQFIGKEYTGCLSLVEMNGIVGVYKHNDFNKSLLQLFKMEGELVDTLELPKPLPWDLRYSNEFNSLFIDVDHYIYKLNLSSMKFEQLTSNYDEPGSFISLSKTKLFFGASPKIGLMDLKTDKTIFTKNVKPELYSGHTHQFIGCVSKNDEWIALCTKSGEIELLNNSGEVVKVIQGDFEMVVSMEFLNEKILLIREQYGTWGLRMFDIENGQELPYSFETDPFYGKHVDSIDIDNEHNKMVVTCRGNASVYDLNSFEKLLSFKIEHCIKRAKAIFAGDNSIAIRTDYGCFSLYTL